MEDMLFNYHIWLYYNKYGKVSLDNIGDIVNEFIEATSGEQEHCNCKLFKGKSVNIHWDSWHCNYCLKPILNDR
jgi:hypothetical protein